MSLKRLQPCLIFYITAELNYSQGEDMTITEKIHTLFEPRSVAIIGASKSIGKWGFTFLLHLTKGGFTGDVYPVNPTIDELLGKRVYASLKEIPGPVDAAYILIPPRAGGPNHCPMRRNGNSGPVW